MWRNPLHTSCRSPVRTRYLPAQKRCLPAEARPLPAGRYVESFRELRAFPPIKDMESEAKFNELITRIMARHNNVVPMIASGVFALREARATLCPQHFALSTP